MNLCRWLRVSAGPIAKWLRSFNSVFQITWEAPACTVTGTLVLSTGTHLRYRDCVLRDTSSRLANALSISPMTLFLLSRLKLDLFTQRRSCSSYTLAVQRFTATRQSDSAGLKKMFSRTSMIRSNDMHYDYDFIVLNPVRQAVPPTTREWVPI